MENHNKTFENQESSSCIYPVCQVMITFGFWVIKSHFNCSLRKLFYAQLQATNLKHWLIWLTVGSFYLKMEDHNALIYHQSPYMLSLDTYQFVIAFESWHLKRKLTISALLSNTCWGATYQDCCLKKCILNKNNPRPIKLFSQLYNNL